ncbi:MAG: alpha/beta fold hydrolase [Clostridia bacterium]|nr:alpha/beta fold hydrolase [Clostridia bacterium]
MIESVVCKTEYPILLVHGAGFRDLKTPVYWGRIPNVLRSHGATVFFGEQDCWASTETNAHALCERIDAVLKETGAKKVNIIAHSKGGLEARMAASSLNCADRIASITTIGTPHRGSKTFSIFLRAPRVFFSIAAFAVNNWIRLIGDREPDFRRVCEEFAVSHMERFNAENPDAPGVFYQSVAGVMRRPFSDINLCTACFVLNRIEGPNDGLVSAESARWGERCIEIRGNTRRGISHLDEIDFRRSAFSKKTGKDVRDITDFYVELVHDLKNRGF